MYGDLENAWENRGVFWAMQDRRGTAADVYALGLVVYMIAARTYKPEQVGTDPGALRISREYGTPGLEEAILRCLVVDPLERAEMSHDSVRGLLPALEGLREARNQMVKTGWPLRSTDWARPQPQLQPQPQPA